MKANADTFNLVGMANILGVTLSGYYSYLNRGISNHDLYDAKLLEEIKSVFHDSRDTYGRNRIYVELRKLGFTCSERRVSRLMKENGLIAKARRRFKVTTKADANAVAAPNHLQQDFIANKPNNKWVSDITYIRTAAGWLYVAVVMDLFSRKIIGLAMSNRITKELVCRAFLQAMLHRGYPINLLYHSDRGSQYTSDAFQKLMRIYKIQASMSGTGNCYDSAAI